MTFSRIIFLAAFALLTLTSCHAWAIVQGLRQTRPHSLDEVMKSGVKHMRALLLACVLCSCSTQVATTNDGTRLVNNNLLAKGGMIRQPDGTTVMFGDSETAAKELGKYGKLLINAGLITRGVEAVQSVGNNAIDAVK